MDKETREGIHIPGRKLSDLTPEERAEFEQQAKMAHERLESRVRDIGREVLEAQTEFILDHERRVVAADMTLPDHSAVFEPSERSRELMNAPARAADTLDDLLLAFVRESGKRDSAESSARTRELWIIGIALATLLVAVAGVIVTAFGR